MSDQKYTLKIYIAGASPDSQTAILKLKEDLEDNLGRDNYVLTVIDVLERPELAEEERILATPTVVRSLPGPAKQLIVDFSNTESILVGLDLIKKDE